MVRVLKDSFENVLPNNKYSMFLSINAKQRSNI